MSDDSSTNRPNPEEAKRLLAQISFVKTACELDVLVFLHRHPRTFLTNEQLAVFVGYDMKQVAKATDAFIDAGLLKRTQNTMHAARLYSLVLEGPKGEEIKGLLELASTRQGRQEILRVLSPAQPKTPQAIAEEKRKALII